ncbi:MAG: hypothetical protein JO222_03935, partial [Frankiales bacterium]|nr:hypothetical protein [Frankiales bacterium]
MLTPYTEQDLKDVLVLEAADTPVVPELWQQLQRRRARRRLQLTSGAAVVAVVLTGTLVTT